MNGLAQILEQSEAERLATGFVFTEGPLWHPDGFYYFVDVRASRFYRMRPGGARRSCARNRRGQRHDLRPARPAGDLRRRQPPAHPLVGDDQASRGPDGPLRGQAAQPAERCRLQVGRQHLVHRPRAAGAARRTRAAACRASIAVEPDGTSRLVAEFEYPNGLAFSPDERVLYVANTRARSTSMRSSSTAPATWCGGASSPTCRPTRPTACPTA